MVEWSVEKVSMQNRHYWVKSTHIPLGNEFMKRGKRNLVEIFRMWLGLSLDTLCKYSYLFEEGN